MADAPAVDATHFVSFSGLTLTASEEERVVVAIDRARRRLLRSVDLTDVEFTADEVSDWRDAVSQLAWLYWEAEKASAMEVLAVPLTQLSLGTLFWTKSQQPPWGHLDAVMAVLEEWSPNSGHTRIVLEGELAHPET